MLELTFGAEGDLRAVFDGVDMTASPTQGGSDAAPVFTVADIESRLALPRKSGNSGLPRGRIRRLGENRLAVEFIRSTAALDLEYRVQFCSDLESNWADAVTTVNVTSESGSWERIVVEDNVPMDEAHKRFGRVVVIEK